jgi:hypothetical protein
MFLCFVDRDAQRPRLRSQTPDDYRLYLGGRQDESRHFKEMAKNDCLNIIEAIPSNSKFTTTPRSNRKQEWQNMHTPMSGDTSTLK